MNYIFHSEAEREFYEAIDYYEARRENLGLDLSREVYLAIDRILEFPELWSKLDSNIRRALVDRFSYAILYDYESENEIIYIVAVMNLYQEPRYWSDRL